MNKMTLIIILSLIALAVPAFATTHITGCQTISSPDTYLFDNSVYPSGSSTCFTVTVNTGTTVIDCQGQDVINSSTSTPGYTFAFSGASHVTLQNCNNEYPNVSAWTSAYCVYIGSSTNITTNTSTYTRCGEYTDNNSSYFTSASNEFFRGRLTSNASHVTVTSDSFYDNYADVGLTSVPYAMWFIAGSHLDVEYNYCYGPAYNSSSTLAVDGIDDCIAVQNTSSTVAMDDIKVKYNYGENFWDLGFEWYGKVTNLDVEGNSFHGRDASTGASSIAAAAVGTYFGTTDTATIYNNSAYGTVGAINISGITSMTNFNISYNSLNSYAYGYGSTTSFSYFAPDSSATISGNTLTGNTFAGPLFFEIPGTGWTDGGANICDATDSVVYPSAPLPITCH